MIKFLIFSFCLIAVLHQTYANCRVSVNGDLGTPQPLLLRPNKELGNAAFYLPSDNKGNINIPAKAIVDLHCPGSEITINKQSLGKSSVHAQCVSGKLFTITGNASQQNFVSLACKTEITNIARYTNKSCLNNNFKEIEIGFSLNDGRFLPHVNICFDTGSQNSVYSVYNLTSQINGYQYSYPRPEFAEDNFYSVGKNKVNALYVRNVQRININRQLGLGSKDYKYIQETNFNYLARGHLTAKADFVFGTQQSATFHYVNAAPQWQTFNGANWNELEKSVRYFAGDNGRNLTVYTGTHGITTLPHEKTGADIKLHLYDENGKKALPVPQLVWKVLYEETTQAGVAFVGVNNPYHSQNQIEEYRICKDICSQIKWKISWDKNNLASGYSYCCEVNEFRNTVKNLPHFIVKQLLN